MCKQVGKGEIKLPLFVDDILCIENPKDSTKKEKKQNPKTVRTNKFSKVAEYKVYKNLLYLYIIIVNQPKQKLRKKNHIYNCISKDKISRDKLN